MIAAILCLVAGCALPRQGTLAESCSVDSACQDDNPCTVGRCHPSGVCEQLPRSDGPLPQQTAGDCLTDVCVDGELVQEPDPGDVIDDGNDCTADTCTDGAPIFTRLPDGTRCENDAGKDGICADGLCEVGCAAATVLEDCGDLPCSLESCSGTGVCVYEPLDNVESPEQIRGDCKVTLCQEGDAVDVTDDFDLPIDGNDCTEDLCSAGVPTNPPLLIGTACNQDGGRVCNGDALAPGCVECNAPADCTMLPADDECQERTCTNNACGQSFAPVNTPLASQQAGDCLIEVCDGSGGIQQRVDDTDLPVDGNECTADVCSGGVPSNPFQPVNSPCGSLGALYCDGAGACRECLVSSQCGTDTFCQQHVCSPQNVCEVINTPQGTVLPAASQSPGDCQRWQCNGAGLAVEVADDTDLPADDGNACTDETCVNGAPMHPPSALDTPCTENNGSYCDGNGACVACNSPAQCPAAPDCQQATCIGHACGFADEPQGFPAPASYQSPGDCLVVVCDGMGAVAAAPGIDDDDLPVDGNECTRDVCSSGIPSNPPEPAGTTCTAVPGWVCNGDPLSPECVECATNTECVSPEVCDIATWSCCTPATCAQLGRTCGVHPDGCGGLVSCDGAQDGAESDLDCGGSVAACAARCAVGQACGNDGDCANGTCVDGYCCDALCDQACDACDLPGQEGSCSPRPDGSAGDPSCAGGYLCDGSSAVCPAFCGGDGDCAPGHYCLGMACQPKSSDGATCTADNQCLSGSCADGRCCDNPCAGVCEACDVAGFEGTCSPIAAGSDPASECAGADVCNGAGACRCADGMVDGAETDVDCGGGVCPTCGTGLSCAMPADCTSGVCEAQLICAAPVCGDGVVNGSEACDWADPLTPCCASDCMGVALPGQSCGSDPDGSGCAAPPACDGAGTAPSSCVPSSEPDMTPCTDDGLYCNGTEVCMSGACVGSGDPCLGQVGDGDADCSEACDESSLGACILDDPPSSSCDNGGGPGSGVCDGAGVCQ